MIPSAILTAFPQHRIRARGRLKLHAIPVDAKQPHQAHSGCACRPVLSGAFPSGPYGRGLWVHQ